eukprot:1119610-Lingulodinium_polyedra.AAC.1
MQCNAMQCSATQRNAVQCSAMQCAEQHEQIRKDNTSETARGTQWERQHKKRTTRGDTRRSDHVLDDTACMS